VDADESTRVFAGFRCERLCAVFHILSRVLAVSIPFPARPNGRMAAAGVFWHHLLPLRIA
jgi:hypothetical protein